MGATGLEPVTSAASRQRSPTELSALQVRISLPDYHVERKYAFI